jgi:hypothetical protein
MRQFRAIFLGIAFAFCISPCGGFAQDGDITTQTQVSSSVILGWLDSGDPRLVAWGAYFSTLNGDPSGDATMVEILDRWAAAGDQRDELSETQQDAFAAILDALIQHHRTVAPETLALLAAKFPAQAAILASRLPLDEAMPLLQNWYAERKTDRQPALARIAAMMLSKAPPPGFAASVLAETSETVRISVVDPGVGVGGGGGGGYGLGGSIFRRQGWPPVYGYLIEEHAQATGQPLVVEAGGDRITYRRTPDAVSVASVRPLDDETRQHLLLEMLGGDRSALQWKTQQQISLEWDGPANYLSEVGNLVDEEESKLRDTVDAFYVDGLLTPEEAGKVRPSLLVNVFDDRGAEDSPIPQFESRDPHTTVALVISISID